MNPVKLIFRHGGEMLVSPIGLRFVEDPDHGPLVLIPEFGQPRGYQLDMTLEQARQAFSVATLTAQIPAPGEISRLEGLIAELKTHAFGVAAEIRDLRPAVEMHETRLDGQADSIYHLAKKWQALRIHLGLPEGWEHLHELAAGAKGALVSQAEMLDAIQAELSMLKEQDVLFSAAERIGELEEAHRLLRNRTEKLESREEISSFYRDKLDKVACRVAQLSADSPARGPVDFELPDKGTTFPLLDDRTCVQRQVDWTGGKPREWHEGWEVGHGVGMRDQQYLDSLEPEKPKSAWRPAQECRASGWYFVGVRGYRYTARPCYYRVDHWDQPDLDKAGFGNPVNLEFCPIPE